MNIGLVGTGPAAHAVAAALEDVDVEVTDITPGDLNDVDVGVVIGMAGSGVFLTANEASTGPWFAVELGGIGGFALDEVEAAITGISSRGGCFECLRSRVESTTDTEVDAEPRATTSDARFAGAVAGRAAVSLAAGERDILGTVFELPYRERRLLPVPDCQCDRTGRDGRHTLDRSAVDRPVDVVAEQAEEAVDDRIGLITSIGEAHSFPAPYYLATLADSTAFSDARVAEQAAGVDAGWDAAFVKAVGEGLERYCAAVYRGADFINGPAGAIDDAISPIEFVRPDVGYDAPDPSATIPWVPGENLHTGDLVHLPAELVHFPPPVERFRPGITTGLGLGSSGCGALLSGLYEAIERDATMLAWYSTYEPLRLHTEDPVVQTLTGRARGEGLSVSTVLVTQDIDVPVVSAAVYRDNEWPRFAAGSAAHLDPNRAARSAVAEAIQNWMELRSIGPEGAADESAWIGRYADSPAAALELIEPDGSVSATQLSPEVVPSGEAALDAVLQLVAGSDLDVFAARLTTRDVETLGFEVARVLVPAAQPLFVGDRFFGERARSVPRSLGYRPRLDREPHPYP